VVALPDTPPDVLEEIVVVVALLAKGVVDGEVVVLPAPVPEDIAVVVLAKGVVDREVVGLPDTPPEILPDMPEEIPPETPPQVQLEPETDPEKLK
jgi:hypothetical protein